MRLGILTALGVGVVLALAGAAEAEKVKSNQRAEVYAKPGEQSRVLMRIKEGQAMTVIEREGRWLKVRVKGRTGYVPRSKIDEDRSDRINRNTRRRPFVDGRSTERGWGGGAPDDRVGADAVDNDDGEDDDDDDRGSRGSRDDDDDDDRDRRGSRDDDDDDDRDRRDSRDDDDDDDRDRRDSRDDDDDDDDRDRDRDDDDDDDDRDRRDDDEDERPTVKVTAKRVTLYERPSKSSEELGSARRGDTFYFMREDGNWVMVENDEGDAVWVKSSSISRDDGDDDDDGGRRGGRQITAIAGGGVKLVGQRLRTPNAMNDMPPDNYKLGTSAATIQIGGELLYPYGKSYLIGGSADYAGSKAIPGISYDGSTTGVTFHDFDIRAMGGYDLKNGKGMVAYARLGYHYENMAIANVGDPTKNTAQIPSEVFSAPVIGAALDVHRLTDKLALRVILDAVVFGANRKQTRFLEDGSNPSVKGVWLTGCLGYKWKKKMMINGAYELTYMNTNFGAQKMDSTRHPAGAGNTTRRDLNHSVIVNVGYSF